jgi:hypothetical protein
MKGLKKDMLTAMLLKLVTREESAPNVRKRRDIL